MTASAQGVTSSGWHVTVSCDPGDVRQGVTPGCRVRDLRTGVGGAEETCVGGGAGVGRASFRGRGWGGAGAGRTSGVFCGHIRRSAEQGTENSRNL